MRVSKNTHTQTYTHTQIKCIDISHTLCSFVTSTQYQNKYANLFRYIVHVCVTILHKVHGKWIMTSQQ